jgi:hypothetical protein
MSLTDRKTWSSMAIPCRGGLLIARRRYHGGK